MIRPSSAKQHSRRLIEQMHERASALTCLEKRQTRQYGDEHHLKYLPL
jgi:hypothetical protein